MMAHEQLWKLPKVMDITCKSKFSIYSDIKGGTFPKQKRTGKRSVAWLASDVMAWLANLEEV